VLQLPLISEPPTLVKLTNDVAVDELPVWSPDGKSIAFVNDRDGNPEIYTMDADSSNVRQLTNDLMPTPDNGEQWHYDRPSWFPSGETIAAAMVWCRVCLSAQTGARQAVRQGLNE
jgi:Tol biopolymer transport system component